MAQPPPIVPTTMRELAARIYVDLAVRAAQADATSIKMQAPPESLAKLSFRLAAIFEGVERELAEANRPDPDFKLDAAAIASWTK